MDDRLVGWARAVKSRRPGGTPALWLFTDALRMGDVAAAVRGLPRGLCGVVFRHDAVVGRAELLQAVWRICRMRRLALTVAGRGTVPRGAGRHLRGGAGVVGPGFSTASAHGFAEVVRARRRASLVFLSPAFPTASHPGGTALGAVRWARLARAGGAGGAPVLALGGVDGRCVRRLGRGAAGAGAIGALLPG